MNDLYSLELSSSLLQAVEAGMLTPIEAPGVLAVARTWMAYQSDERAVHRALVEFRRHLEWFEIGLDDAVARITAILQRPPVSVLKAADFVPLQTGFMLKWQQVTLDRCMELFADMRSLLDRIVPHHQAGRDVSQVRRALNRIFQKGRFDAVDMLDVQAHLNPLRAHSLFYVATHARHIHDLLGGVSDECLNRDLAQIGAV
jgi:hypothetical protein